MRDMTRVSSLSVAMGKLWERVVEKLHNAKYFPEMPMANMAKLHGLWFVTVRP